MTGKEKELKGNHLFSKKREMKGGTTTKLPPKNYLHMKENKQI